MAWLQEFFQISAAELYQGRCFVFSSRSLKKKLKKKKEFIIIIKVASVML